MDLIGEAEKLGDFMLNVVEGVKHQFKAPRAQSPLTV